MSQPPRWFTLLSVLLCTQQASADITCEPPNSSCSQCYAKLVQQVTEKDRNQFEVQRTFFPPDRSPPSFVTVFYNYSEDGVILPNKTVWFWSTSTFYLYHPLHVFQFTSLLFSDPSQHTANITLVLDADCLDADEDHMRLFTQRLKLLATTETSVTSLISDRYSPRVETAHTIINKENLNKRETNYTTSAFYIFPVLTAPLILLAVTYYNDLTKHNRMKKIRNVFSTTDIEKKKSLKNQLQNEFVMSLYFDLYTLALASTGVHYTIYTENYLNREVAEYFNLKGGTVRSRHNSSLAITAFGLDLIVVTLQLTVGLICCCYYWYIGNIMCLWKYCAYSIVFPLCCAANHLNYITIAFIHDVYHATGVATIYGITIFLLYAMLWQLSRLLDYCNLKLIARWGPPHNQNGLIQNKHQQQQQRPYFQRVCDWLLEKCVSWFMSIKLLIKLIAVILSTGYILYDVFLYYYIPISNSFDDATHHLLYLYQTTAVFFAAIVAYFFFNRPFRSAINILTRAENRSNVFNLRDNNNQWENMTTDERDMLMGREILQVLRHLGQAAQPPP